MTAGPVTTWGRVAEVLGISRDTLDRRRKAAKDATGRTPWFENEAAVFDWYRAVLARRSTPTTAPIRRPPAKARAFDADALAIELGIAPKRL